MLTTEAIHKRFGRSQVLNGVDLTLAPGTITAIIGPSGGGKSTLIRALALLDPPDSGSITVDDHTYSFPMKGNGQRAPWPDVTVVFQQLFLWPHLTLRRNIQLPLEQRRMRSDASEVSRLLTVFELEEIADRHPNEVSIGQRQRAALVRALALQPTYLLLDEITSALDVEHVGRVLEELKQQRAGGMAILLVTHLIGFARTAADHIVFLERGSIVEQGPPDLLARPRTERLERFLSLVDTAR